MILFRRLYVVLIILGLSLNFGYGQDDVDVGAPLGDEDVGSAKGLILLKGLKGLAKLKLFKGLLKDKWKLGLAKGFLLGKIVGAPNPFGGGETADETADYFFEESPEDVQASLWGGQQFDPDFHPERSPYHMNHQYNYNIQQNGYNRDHEQNLGVPYQHPHNQHNYVDENMYRTMEKPEFSMNNYPQYYGYQPNYDPYEYEGMQASNLEPVKIKVPNDDLYGEMESATRNYYQGVNTEFGAKSRLVRQGPVGPDPRKPYRNPDFMLQSQNPAQPNLQPADQPIMWYSFNEGSKPYAIDFNYETSQYRKPTEQHQTDKATYESTTSDEVGAPSPVHDHMSHITEEDQNVNPIIMQEYVSSVHDYNYDQQKNYNNQKKRTNDLEKKMSTDVNSKDMKQEETEEISTENSVSSSVEVSTVSNAEKDSYETYAKKERENEEIKADTTQQQSSQMKNARLEKRQEAKRLNYDDVTKMNFKQSDNEMNSFMGQQAINEAPQRPDDPHDLKKMMETLQTLPGNQKEMFDHSEKTGYQQAQKPGTPELREVFFNGEKAVEYRFPSPKEAVIPGDSQMYYDTNPARSMYQQYTPTVSQDQNGEIVIDEQYGRAIVVPPTSMPVTTPTESTGMMLPELIDPTSPYGMQYQYQPEPQSQYRYTEDDPSTMVYSYDEMQYRMPMNGQPQFYDAQQPLEEMTPQMPEHERTFHKGNLFGILKYNGGYGGYPGKLANKKGKGKQDKYSHHEYSSYDSHHYGGYSHGGGHAYGGYSHGSGDGGYSHGSGHGGYSHGSGHGGYSHGSGYGHGHGYSHGYLGQPNPTEFAVGPESYTSPVMKRSASLNTDLVASETTNEHPVVKRQDCKCPQTWGPPPPAQDYVAGPYQRRLASKPSLRKKRSLNRPGFFSPTADFLHSINPLGRKVLNFNRPNPYVESPMQSPYQTYTEPMLDSGNSYYNRESVLGSSNIKEVTLSGDDPSKMDSEIYKTIMQHTEQSIRDALAKASVEPLQIGSNPIVVNEEDLKPGAEINSQSMSDSSHPHVNLQPEPSTMSGISLHSPSFSDNIFNNLPSEVVPLASSKVSNPFYNNNRNSFTIYDPITKTFEPPQEPQMNIHHSHSKNYNYPPQEPSTTQDPLESFKLFENGITRANSFRELLEAIKTKLFSCCEKCKDKILKGIHEKIDEDDTTNSDKEVAATADTYTATSHESFHPTNPLPQKPYSTQCKGCRDIYKEIESLSRDIWLEEQEYVAHKNKKGSNPPISKTSLTEKKCRLKKLLQILTELKRYSSIEDSFEGRSDERNWNSQESGELQNRRKGRDYKRISNSKDMKITKQRKTKTGDSNSSRNYRKNSSGRRRVKISDKRGSRS